MPSSFSFRILRGTSWKQVYRISVRMLRGTSSKQVYRISIRDNFHATSRRRLHMKVFLNSSHECVVVTIDNRFCLQTSKYFSLEFSEEVIRS